MLTQDLLTALKGYTQNLENSISFVLQTGNHEKRNELKEFLTQFVSVSDKLKLVEADVGLRSGVSFDVRANGEKTGMVFSGVPGGHEFNSLVLAVLQADKVASGGSIKLDDSIQNIVKAVKEPLQFEVFVSLSCHNCPDIVQTLNQFALLNDNITSEMIDGGVFPQLIQERDIQGVPSVYLNGELFANGKVEPAKLIEKLQEQNPNLMDDVKIEALPIQDVTVLGGGPAGAAAAIYAARKGLNVTVIADRIGGQVKDTMGIENLISVPYTEGPKLTGQLQAHMDEYEITFRQHVKVERIEKGKTKLLHLSSGETIETKTVIVATGAKWRELNVPGEAENIGNGVAYCPHCDGPFFKGKDVAVVGGGNSGIEAALDLAGIVNKVTVLEFGDTLRADQVLIDQANKRDNIEIIKQAATQEITAKDGKVNALVYQDRESEQVKTVDLDGVFVQIGLVPNSQFLKNVIELSPHGEVVINDRGETSEPGIFACGDVTTVPYKQIIIAMGEGAKASLAAFDYLVREGL